MRKAYTRYKNAIAEFPIMEMIPEIEVVIISHDHYDHLEYDTIIELRKKNPNINIYVGQGIKELFPQELSQNITEFKWWDFVTYKNIKFCFLPAQHWCQRGVFDRNKVIYDK